ncbi:MAG TPA: DM9 repeat-containing protein [Spirochaetia bacterium]|nr:DM9 repeat-containing protein [Spirochaetia bacterium]
MRRSLLVLFLACLVLSSAVAADKPAWLAAKGALPGLAMPVGYTDTGAPVYMARVVKSGVASIGRFVPPTVTAQIMMAKRTAPAASFELWTGAGRWVPADASSLPADAISAGRGADGRDVLLARVSYRGWLVPAMFDWQQEAAVADIAGARMTFSTFEVLVPDWVNVKNVDAMQSAFVGGTDADGSNLVPLRAARGKGVHPGKWSAGSGKGYVSYGGKEIELGQQGYELFIGTGTWTAPQGKALPFGAILAGRDDDGSPLYMIRSKVNNADSLGKYSSTRKQAYVPFGGKELEVSSFEVLCYDLSPNRPDSVPTQSAAAPAPAPAMAAPQPAPVPPAAPTPDVAADADWQSGALWGTGPGEWQIPATPAPAKIVPAFGYWTVNGTLDQSETQREGLLADAYLYAGQKGEQVTFFLYSESATPGFYIGAPSRQYITVAPRTGEGEFPEGGSSTVKATLPETGTYTILVANAPAGAGSYLLRVQGRGQSFSGTLAPSAAFAPVEVQVQLGAFYTIEVTSDSFDPGIVIMDKKTQKPLEVTVDQTSRRAFTTAYANDGQALVIQVRPANPKASPPPKGAFKVEVRLDNFGS